jgi:hypothetical protein
MFDPDSSGRGLEDSFREALEAEQESLGRMPNRQREELKAAILEFLDLLPDVPPEQRVASEGVDGTSPPS